jgi:thiamine biosynthesis lipoprotein
VSVFVLASAVAVASFSAPPPLFHHEATRLSMACAYSIVAYGADAAALPRIVEEAFDEVDRIDRLMSHYKQDSPLSQLNREAARGPVPVDPELFDFIARSLQYSRESDGAFDITVGPLMKAWGFFNGDGRVPNEGELRDVRSRIGYRHVVLDSGERTIRFDVAGVELDLGGIAKGYAVDRVVALLQRRGIAAALVSAGGSTVYAFRAPPGRDAWDVNVQDPLAPGKIALKLPLRDRALSVAGSSEKYFEVDGVRYSHIMDPRTGKPVQGVLSVAVLAASGTEADALDEVLFVKGIDASRAYLARQAEAEAYFLLPERGGWTITALRSGR